MSAGRLTDALKRVRDRIPRPIQRALKGIAEPLFQIESNVSRRWASSAHHRLMMAQWGLRPQPEHFDHQIDLYHSWTETRSSLWLERGVFGSLALVGGDVLELACGDGFNARNFYSLRSRKIVACDFDPSAIRTARRKNAAPNIEFVLADIRTSMPEGEFDNVIWDAAIEHFTAAEIDAVLSNIKRRLRPGGILSGYTMVEREDGVLSLEHHENEFKNKEHLMSFLAPHFSHVTVFETIYPSRHNLYFWATDTGTLPFEPGWKAMDRKPAHAGA